MDAGARRMLALELRGRGVEFGPGRHPLLIVRFVTEARYCDAHDREGFAAAFPELGEAANAFPHRIDLRLHFDREPFVDLIGRESLDFVVANHVLEHLLNPIEFLLQCYEVSAPGGLMFLGVPDKRRIFDRCRRRTSLGELVARRAASAAEPLDEDIDAFIRDVYAVEPPPLGSPERTEEFARQRRRFIHVNVWILDDVVELFVHLGRALGTPWALYDGALADEEFLLLFGKRDRAADLENYPLVLNRLHAEANRRHADALAAQADAELAEVRFELAETSRFVRGLKKAGRAVPGGETLRRWVKSE